MFGTFYFVRALTNLYDQSSRSRTVVNTHKINYLVTCRLNLTLEDLEADEVEDENWQQGLSTAGKSDTKVTASGKKTRVIPRRRVAEKKAAFSDESE